MPAFVKDWTPNMKITLNSNTFFVSLALILSFVPVSALLAEEIDFSCMKQRVLGKTQVSKNYKEFDVILENRCPGRVYWSMCIERMNPWTIEKLETLSPAGQVEKDKKTRVNLRMKVLSDDANSRQTYEEFYLNIDFAINSYEMAQCVASDCESKKREIRGEIRTNDKALQKAKDALAAKIASECPATGWGGAKQLACEDKVRETSQGELEQIEQQDKALKERLAAVDPERCQVYGGVESGI